MSVFLSEETGSFPVKLTKYFSHDDCKLIEELIKRYMDNGLLPWHFALDLNVLKNFINNLHLTIKLTADLEKFDSFSKILVINFLGITVLLQESGYVETDMFYKETSTHDYLNYSSYKM